MRRRRGYVAPLVSVLAWLVVVAGATTALADNVTSDGDTLSAGRNLSITNCAVAHSFGGTATVSFQGGGGTQHFASGATLTVTAAPTSAGASAGITASGGSLTLPSPWNSSSPAQSTFLSLSVPAGIGNGTYRVDVRASGARAFGGTLQITDFYNVNVNCPTNTPPIVAVPGDITVEATGAGGAIVTFSVTASDTQDGTLTPSCVPSSGGTFALGTTLVSCSVTDSGGLTGSASFNVIVTDTTAPVLALPAAITVEASGPGGAPASFTADASDLVSGSVPVSCDAVSGDLFPLGATTVSCSATDAAGNTGSGSFTVTVVDTTPPDLSVPADITAEATGPAGAAVGFATSAEDLVDGSLTPTCDAVSGDLFPLGTTSVSCSATDAASNTGSGSFTVTVVDTTPPTLTMPLDITVYATSSAGATVTFDASAADLVDGDVGVACSPASGALFPIGTTTVSCTSTDAHGNVGTGNVTVRVLYAFAGFFQPVDNPSGSTVVWNRAKAGSATPVKFGLGGDRGLAIFADGSLLHSMFGPDGPGASPWTEKVGCSSGVTEDVIETTVTANASGLIYDAAARQYNYIWRTSAAWANTCRVLHVTLRDGTDHIAYFRFVK